MITVTRKSKNNIIAVAILAILAYFLIYPIGRLFLSSFQKSALGGPSKFTLQNYVNMFTDSQFLASVKTTIIVGFEATLLATTVGVLLAWFIARTDMPLKKLLEPLNLIPFYLSSLVGALSWEILAAPYSGLLNQAARGLFGMESSLFNIYSTTGISLLVGLHYIPFVYLFSVGTLQNMDPSLEDAARVSGASTFQNMLRVTLPLAGPAILSASILTFVLSAGHFAVPLVLGVPKRIYTLSTLIYSQLDSFPPNYNAATAISSVLLFFVIWLIIIQRKILSKRHFYTITGKGYRPRLIALKRSRWIALSINLIYLLFTLGPFGIVLLISFLPGYAGKLSSGFSLNNYNTVIFVNEVTQRGFLNSLKLAGVGATLSVVSCFILAGVVHRTRIVGRSSIDFIAMLPVTYPGVVLGMGFLAAWITTPLYGTIWIIMAAYMVHFLPTGLRSLEATLGSISPDLDECARVCGASWLGALRRILLPLMMPGLLSTWLLLFVIFMREVSSSMMLFVFGTETMGVSLFKIMEYESLGASAAFGTLQTVLILAVVYTFRTVTSAAGMHTVAE